MRRSSIDASAIVGPGRINGGATRRLADRGLRQGASAGESATRAAWASEAIIACSSKPCLPSVIRTPWGAGKRCSDEPVNPSELNLVSGPSISERFLSWLRMIWPVCHGMLSERRVLAWAHDLPLIGSSTR